MQMEFLKLDKERENPDLHQCYDSYINLKQLEVSQPECYSAL